MLPAQTARDYSSWPLVHQVNDISVLAIALLMYRSRCFRPSAQNLKEFNMCDYTMQLERTREGQCDRNCELQGIGD
jgi:hypothetical protein